MSTKTILSYGGGVNSSAIIALATEGKLPMPDYIVFADTGAEYSETYKYIEYLKKCKKIPIITLRKKGIRGLTIIEYCREMGFVPSRFHRWCTDRFKIQPLKRFAKKLNEEVQMIIGIDKGEEHRAKRFGQHQYPLIGLEINRAGCKEILKETGFGVPRKSGCFICPYQRKRDWINLKKHHPDLWKIAVELENNAWRKGVHFTYKGMPIEEFVSDLDKQEELPFGIELDQDCMCYFD